MASKKIAIKVYHGYGHSNDLVIYGHTFTHLPAAYTSSNGNSLTNLTSLLRLFLVEPLPRIPLQVIWDRQVIDIVSEDDGFFKAEWKTDDAQAGWHTVKVQYTNGSQPISSAEGKLFVPHKTQFGFISDIDDTIMISHSTSIWKRLGELLFKNPESRRVFPHTVQHYQLLAESHTVANEPNPFFYVSSSEWNLYDYLTRVFTHHRLPEGAFLLNQVKRWYQLWKTGKTKHEGKLLRVMRILDTFPNQQFILIGDNSQMDPAIYTKLAEKYPDRVYAILIRNVRASRQKDTAHLLSSVKDRGVHTIQFSDSLEAIRYSVDIGLIEEESANLKIEGV